MKRLEISVLLAIVFSVLLSMTSLNTECAEIRSSVLRMHVLANSDSEEDQALKLQVRDRLLEVSKEIYSNSTTKEEAVQETNAHLHLLQKEAQKVVASRGFDYPVSVALENTYFTTRTYGDDRRGRRAQLVVRHVSAALYLGGQRGRSAAQRSADSRTDGACGD